MLNRRCAWICLLAVMAGGRIGIAIGADSGSPDVRKVNFHIAQQLVGDALTELGEQSGLAIAISGELARDIVTPPLEGLFTPSEALDRILATTGLRAEFLDGKTVTVLPVRRTAVHVAEPLLGSSATTQPSQGIPYAAVPARESPGDSLDYFANQGSPVSEKSRVEEVVVTGTHISGLSPEDAGARLIVVGRDGIENSGYATLQDVLNTIPQNWPGSTSDDATAQNQNHGAAINLRGLGPDSTLILVDGRRQASGGLGAAYTDISSIPTSAIQRIEILPDGASSIYGSDAVGGVVNVILRKDLRGAETDLRGASFTVGPNEARLSQLLGTQWNTGNVLLGYQFYDRQPLLKIDRSYTSTADFRSFGGTDFRDANSNPGNILCPAGLSTCTPGVPAYGIPANQTGAGLKVVSLLPGITNYRAVNPNEDLLPDQVMHTVFANVSQSIGDRIELSAEGRWAKRNAENRGAGDFRNVVVPLANPFYVNPFPGKSTVTVDYNFIDDLGPVTDTSTTETYFGTVGINLLLSKSWHLTADLSYARESVNYSITNRVNDTALASAISDTNPATAFNVFGAGSNTNPATVNAIRFTGYARPSSRIWEGTIVADGGVIALPAGDIKLAVGVDRRKEDISSAGMLNPGVVSTATLGRSVNAAFGELSIPLIDSSAGIPGLTQLMFSAAGRYEDYSDFGSTTNPRVGIHWDPISSLKVSGTWGTSFKAPRLVDELDSPSASVTNSAFIVPGVRDPQSATGFSNVLFRFGGNPDLRPQKADTWTSGIEFSPPQTGDIDLAVDYFNIKYRNRIAAGGAGLSTLLQPQVWAQLIQRSPSTSEVSDICSRPNSFCFGLTPAAIVDLRLNNIASVDTDGIDASLKHSVRTSYGVISADVSATYTLSFNQQVSGSAPATEFVGTVLNPPKLRLRGGFTWSLGVAQAATYVNYLGRSTDTLDLPNRTIPSWTTMDVQFTVTASKNLSVLRGVRFSFGATNIFNKMPPFVNLQGSGYDSANTNLYGRVISIEISKRWGEL